MLRLMTIVSCFILLLYSIESVRGRTTQFKVGSKQNPGTSCKDIKEHGGTVTGNYYIRVAGQTFVVYCNQDTAGGGWTLVYSYTFVDYAHFGDRTNAVTPHPNFPVPGNVRQSSTPPANEIDYNAMDFNLWKEIGSEFMLKSNINNWYACSDGSGSLVYWHTGTVNCRLVKDYVGKCGHVVPDMFQTYYVQPSRGPVFYSNAITTPTSKSIYYYNTFVNDGEFPSHDPCGIDFPFPHRVPNPHGNVYIR